MTISDLKTQTAGLSRKECVDLLLGKIAEVPETFNRYADYLNTKYPASLDFKIRTPTGQCPLCALASQLGADFYTGDVWAAWDIPDFALSTEPLVMAMMDIIDAADHIYGKLRPELLKAVRLGDYDY